ncbi:MAG: CAP domain-containing protein [Pyrinomonadaceae bacterium]
MMGIISSLGIRMFRPWNLFCLASILTLACAAVYAQPECRGSDVLVARACAGDGNSVEEQQLFQLLVEYRSANSLPEIRLSRSLSVVANRHLLDLQQNVKRFTHSWSDCSYDLAIEKTWPCINNAPSRLSSGYNGQGYETLYRTATGKASGPAALNAWKKSPLHNSIILNHGTFKNTAWNEVGVAIDGAYAALWFGTPSAEGAPKVSGLGLGVSYGEAVSGLTRIFSIKSSDTTVGDTKWQGVSLDKTVKLELLGSDLNISQTRLAVSVELKGGRMSDQAQISLSTLLKNIFPDWVERDAWIASSIVRVTRDPTAVHTKVIRKINVEIARGSSTSFKLTITPAAYPKYVEVF